TAIQLYVDDEKVATDVQPVKYNNRVMVPIRVIAETIGADVEWHQDKNAVLINSIPGQAKLTSEPIQLIVNGLDLKPDVSPFLFEERTMVPIRWVSEALGLQVTWEQATESVYIAEQPHTKPSMDLYGWASVEAEGIKETTGGGDAKPQTVTTRA